MQPQRETILYEIAMAIGNSFDIEKVSKDVLSVFLRKLSAKGGIVFEEKNGAISIVFALPRRVQESKLFLEFINSLDKELDIENISKDGQYFYIFKLKDFGYFVFAKEQKLDDVILKSLKPVMDKLATSLKSCRLHEQTQENLQRAKKAEKIKLQFLANMSHEIRTPLNGIIGFTKILARDKTLSSKAKEIVSTIDNSGSVLLKIVNEILDISKLESAGLDIEALEFSPIFSFKDAVELFRAKAHEKNINYKAFIDPKLPVRIVGDKFRITQVISNLIGNAIKFTDNGGEVSVEIRLEKISKDNCQIFFSIKDSGIGIPKEKQSKIFEIFTQASSSINRKYGGTGLGLAISAKLVEAMGGKIEIKSEVGKGSEFYFALPFKIAKITDKLKDKLNDLDILIYHKNDIVDNYFVLLKKYLQSIGRVEVVDNLKLPLNHIYDVAFISEEALRYLDDIDSLNVPLIIVSENENLDIKYKKFLLLKVPYSVSSIFEVLLELKNSNKDIFDNAVKIDKELESDVIQFKGKVLIAEDHPINQELLSMLLDERGIKEYDVANDGKEAILNFKQNSYDLILMDINMPIVSGVGALKNILEVEKQENIPHTPIVALTANALQGDRERFLSLGFDDYLSKPIEEEELDKILRRYLKPFTKENKEIKENKKETIKKKNELKLPQDVIKRLKKMFFDNLDKDLNELKKGIETDDFEKIFQVAHKIKGASANLRLEEISQIAKTIEKNAKEKNKIDYQFYYEKLLTQTQ